MASTQGLLLLPLRSLGCDRGVGGRGGEGPSTCVAGLIVAWVGGWASELLMCRIRRRVESSLSCRVGSAAADTGGGKLSVDAQCLT